MAFDLEPRAHFYWMDFDADTGFDSTGQLFDTDGKDVARCSCEPQAHG